MKPVEILQQRAPYKLTPEMEEMRRKLEKPQDLNEALLSVKLEEAAQRIARDLQHRMFAQIINQKS